MSATFHPLCPCGADAVTRFSAAIAHGDDEHRRWLSKAAEQFIADEPVPPPRPRSADLAMDSGPDLTIQCKRRGCGGRAILRPDGAYCTTCGGIS